MDQFFWENCAGTPVQNFPTILKMLKMMRMIIIRCCCICFLSICFEIVDCLADIKFWLLCMIVCFIMRWCNAPQSCLPFLLSPNFRSGYMCAASLQSTVLTFTFSTTAFFWGGHFLPTYTYQLANRTQQVEIDFSYIDVSPLLNVLIPQHSNFGCCLKSTQHNVTGLTKYGAHFYFRKYISFDNCGTLE